MATVTKESLATVSSEPQFRYADESRTCHYPRRVTIVAFSNRVALGKATYLQKPSHLLLRSEMSRTYDGQKRLGLATVSAELRSRWSDKGT